MTTKGRGPKTTHRRARRVHIRRCDLGRVTFAEGLQVDNREGFLVTFRGSRHTSSD